MTVLKLIFITVAVVNILTLVDKWIEKEDEQFIAILGWYCAILYCL